MAALVGVAGVVSALRPNSRRSGFPRGCLKAGRQLCSGNEHRECPIRSGFATVWLVVPSKPANIVAMI